MGPTRGSSDRHRAERAVYAWTLGIAVLIAVLAAVLPDGIGVAVARRGYGFFAFWYLTVILLSTPWARFHRGTRRARVIGLREAIGNAPAFHIVGHLLAMAWMEPVYDIDFTNPEDLPGIISSLIVTVLALTSLTRVKKRIRPKTWKRLHRWVYLAWALIVLVVVTSRPWTAIPHLAVLIYVVGYRFRLWRSRVGEGRRIATIDRLNYAAMTTVFVFVVTYGVLYAFADGAIGIGIFSGIGA
ncbi:MAG: hypothetical protein GY898_25770 [Proteobacteria bacterium]|nr:hypothetical protein [Pseudomonadota bacterium]